MMRKRTIYLGMGLLAALLLWATGGTRPAAAAPDLICTSVSTGNWNLAARWSCGRVPTAADSAIIAAAHTVTVDVNTANIISLTVDGILNVGDNNTNRTLNVAGDITINTGGTLQVLTTSNANHVLNAGGNFTNNGTFSARPDANSLINVTFNDNANQTVSGTGATNNFNLITINNTGAANNNIVEITATNFAPANGFLTLTDGILKLSGSYTLSNNVFTAAGYTIPAAGGLWLNNPNVTVTAQNTQIDLIGSLQITAGNYNIGTGADDHLRYGNGASFTMEGGTLSITGFFRADATGNIITFNMSGGTITTSNFTADSNSNTSGNFDIIAAGSSFTMSGGTIIMRRDNAGNAPDYRNIAGTVNITGGTIQFGNDASPAGETYAVGITAGTTSLPNVVLNQTNPPTVTLNRPANIFGSLTINTGATLNANAQALSITGNWTNNGTFTSGAQTTTFSGTTPQTISGSSVTGFSTWTVNSGATVIVPDAPTIPTAAVAVTNNGTLQQTRTVNNATVPFLTISTDRYRGVDINTTGTAANLGPVTVTIKGNSGTTCTVDGATSPAYAFRCFDITPTTQGAAQVTLWATTGEQNGIATANLIGYHYTGPWVALTGNTNGTGSNNYVFATGATPSFSAFLLGSTANAPTAVTLNQVGITSNMNGLWVVTVLLLALASIGAVRWAKTANSKR